MTAGSRPLILAKAAGGYLLFKAVKGAGRGIEDALAAGVQYRLLRTFGLAAREADDDVVNPPEDGEGNGDDGD